MDNDGNQVRPRFRDLFRRDERLLPLAAYQELRESGLRADAFAILRDFLARAEMLELTARRDLAVTIANLHLDAPNEYRLWPHPLAWFVRDVLRIWLDEQPGSPVPLRLMALILRDPDLLRASLALDGADDRVRAVLAEYILSAVEFATHHIGESTFLGDEEEALATLEEAALLLHAVPASPALARVLARKSYLDALLEDWMAYRRDPVGRFRQWRIARGREGV